MAQVDAATLPDRNQVIVKVLRPNIARTTIRHDITLMYFGG
ncbi:AarF/UbiB family protein [Coxiella endosymbiont of Rhipicephalus microplus]